MRAQERQLAGDMGSGAEQGAQDGAQEGAQQADKSGISEKLAKRLSAHRTAALQAEVARHPHIALVAMVHRLALRVVLDAYRAEGSPVNISASPQDGLDAHAPA